MRRFVLARHEDVTGLSGTGIIAEGVAWTGGEAALHWMTDWETFVHWPGGIEAILAVHGHNGATVVRWLDAEIQQDLPTSLAPGWEDLIAGEKYEEPPGTAWDRHDDPEFNS